jgi:hypothetical protein
VKSSIKRRFKTRHWITVCLFAVCIVSFVSSLRSEAVTPLYTITDLGPVGNDSNPSYGINNAGDIVGTFLPAGSSSNHPFFRKHGTLTNIDITPGTVGSGSAYTVNASGSAVGYFGSGTQRAFIWSESGGLTYLSPSNLAAQAFGLNDGGHAVGVIEDGSGTGGNAFEWDAVTGFHNLTGNGTVSPFYGFAINNLANVVGSTTQGHAFARLNGNYIDLGTLNDPSSQSSARSISEDNYVVGSSQTPSASIPPYHAFIWFDANSNNQSDFGEMKDLGVLPGGTNVTSEAYDINASHQIVGTAELTSGGLRHAVLWHDDDCNGQYGPSEIKDLSNILSDPDWTLESAQSINDGGQIVGFGTFSGVRHAFLLTPNSAPPSLCSTPTPTPSPTPTPATTSLISVQGTGGYGSTATLSATLYSNDMPVSGKMISFTLNGTAVCGGSTGVTCPTTTASGVATLSGVSLSGFNVGNYPAAVAASFAGDSSYGSASQNGLLTVTPFLLLETGTNAAAVDSVTFVRGPFRVTNNSNFSSDHLTRIIIFTSPLANPEPTLKVFAPGHELRVESFGLLTGVPGLNVSYIVVKLDPILTGSGSINYDLTVSLRDVTSNTATLTIIP